MVLRVGVIGLGMGISHIQGYKKHAGAAVVAVADLDQGRRDRAQKEYGVTTTYADALEMLARERLDVVSIATPNALHEPLTLAAFTHGCHVLCEKPMAMDVRQGARMVAAAKKARRRLMINFSFRFRPQSFALKRIVDDGRLGHVYSARTCWLRRSGMPGFGGWFGQKKLAGGGPLIDLGVHRIDLALWLMGHPKPTWVMGGTSDAIAAPKAKREKKAFDVENHATGLVRFADGATLSVEASWACHRSEPEFMETHLYGDKAGLVQRNVGGGYDFTAHLFETRGDDHFDIQLKEPLPPTPTAQEHLIQSIIDGTPHLATGEEALDVQKILDALYRSAATGKPVKVG
ncbi:MAG TPA: Gfo/Idh/MocA family oxidoreductase [Planctomycetota bacterium]|nr:Gfo/Idh/MocA family oxidoreductase [Planctomycetota bacterium]